MVTRFAWPIRLAGAGCVLGVVTLAPARGWAQTTQPARPAHADRAGERFGGLTERRGNPEGRGRAAAAATNPGGRVELTDAERREVEAFFQKYSPRRYDKFQDTLTDERKQKLLDMVAVQYRWLQRLEKEDPEVYQIRLKRLPVEDEMFALGWELRHADAKGVDSKAVEETRKKLRSQIRDFVASKLEERQLRLARMEKKLREDQKALQGDKDSMEQLVDRGLAAVENERPGELRDLGSGPPTGPRLRGGGAADAPPSDQAADDAAAGDGRSAAAAR